MVNASKLLLAGTRGSLLAVAQTKLLLGQLMDAVPGVSFDIKTIKTSGDEGIEVVGAFVKEVEHELRKEQIDLAVHSLKDMPTELPSGVVVACTPLRGDHRDCLIARDGMQLNDLPIGAKVGTSSLRRVYQIKLLRPDLELVPIRGNIITRMGKIDNGTVDAVVLATAGLERVGMQDKITQIFSLDELLPAVAQGALAIEVREDDAEVTAIVKSIHNEYTEWAVLAERAFLTALGGGCRMPIAAYADIKEGNMTLRGMMFSENGDQMEQGTIDGPAQDAAIIGKTLAETLLSRFAVKPY